MSIDEATASFAGARRDLVVRHLETLALMGEVTRDADGRYEAARKVGVTGESRVPQDAA